MKKNDTNSERFNFYQKSWDLIHKAELNNYEKYMKVLGLKKYINTDTNLDFGKRKYILVFLNALSEYANTLSNLTENNEVKQSVKYVINNYISTICDLMEKIGYTYKIEEHKEKMEKYIKKDIEQTYKSKRLCFSNIEIYIRVLYYPCYIPGYLPGERDHIVGHNYPFSEMCLKK